MKKKILFVGSEANPFAATGGLADVLGSLPAALLRTDNELDVRVVLPLYKSTAKKYKDKMMLVAEFYLPLSWRQLYCGVYSYELDGVIYYFIDNEYYFARPFLYGSYDDGERFAYFCKAVMEMMSKIGFIPDILHANDWQSALSVIYLKRQYIYREEYASVKAVYTIHNIAYQGIYSFDILGDVFALDAWDRFVVEYDGCINLTKGAIVCSDRLTTVSPTYALEIRDEYYASGLHHIIRASEAKTLGIINGIDTKLYNPASDTAIFKNYTAEDLSGKSQNKRELQRKFSLTENDGVPMIAMISRLASHKGFDLVKCVAEDIMNLDIQLVVLGTGEREYEEFFAYLSGRYPTKCSFRAEFNKELSRQIYAAADIFLMPSKSEPCGLSQMIASRYGAVPIVRETGGLYDTIKPYDPWSGKGNGITFATYNAHDMLDAIYRAIELYKDADRWDELASSAMRMDFSWDMSARKYLEMYNDLS